MSAIIQTNLFSENAAAKPVFPGKAEADFRNYVDSRRQDTVRNHYRAMRQSQTVEFVERMEAKWSKFEFDKLTVREAFKKGRTNEGSEANQFMREVGQASCLKKT